MIPPNCRLLSVLLYGCTTSEKVGWELHKDVAKCFEWILEAAAYKAPAARQLTSSLTAIQVRWVRHAGHCWWSKDELISDILLWTPIHGHTSADQPANLIFIRELTQSDDQ